MGEPSERTSVPRKPVSWIEPARRGDPAALARALETFRPYLTMIAGRLIEPRSAVRMEPSDLVQETLLAAQRGIAGFQGETEAEWRAWLKTVMLNRFANIRRAVLDTRKRGVEHSALPVCLDGRCEFPRRRESPPTPSLPSRIIERNQAIEAALRRLPESQRAMVRWRYIDGLSHEAIGNRLGISSEAARKALTWALSALKSILGPDHDPR